jgi:hypothetical protein
MTNKERHEKLIQLEKYAKELGLIPAIIYWDEDGEHSYTDLSEIAEEIGDEASPSEGFYSAHTRRLGMGLSLQSVNVTFKPTWKGDRKIDNEGYLIHPDSYEAEIS